MGTSNRNNKRIAQNTILLYFRMFLLMGINLFISRVALQTLGIDNYGIYNVVGGMVVMFSILSSSLTTAISRFITVELGKNNSIRLKTVFSTSLMVQILMSIIIATLAEIIGLWFLYNKMSIPDGRLYAAQWVLHCAILSFIIGLINVPYNSCIVAHEKMSAFAYISILEAILKLSIIYLLWITPYDKLIVFAILNAVVLLVIRLVYGIYCHKHFEECTGKPIFDKNLFKEMWGFAGWNMLGNGAAILNTQGINMVMNVFFGVSSNAARGIANQVTNAVHQFVTNFTMAINPQITKSYAAGDTQAAFSLVCQGAKFSYYLMFCLALPIMIEADFVLNWWLVNPPMQAAQFVIWSILASLTTTIGQSLITLMLAHGDIKRYQIFITIIGIIPFPATWIAYRMGADAISSYIIYFIIYYILIYLRIYLVQEKTHIPYLQYIKEVILPTHIVSILSAIFPLAIVFALPSSGIRFFLSCLVSVTCSIISIYTIGLNRNERLAVTAKAKAFTKKIFKHAD